MAGIRISHELRVFHLLEALCIPHNNTEIYMFTILWNSSFSFVMFAFEARTQAFWFITLRNLIWKEKYIKEIFEKKENDGLDAGVGNFGPAEFSSPVCGFLVILKTLISFFRCVWLGLELNSTGPTVLIPGLEGNVTPHGIQGSLAETGCCLCLTCSDIL